LNELGKRENTSKEVGNTLSLMPFVKSLQVGKVHVDVYFPEGRWYDYYSGKEMTSVKTMHVISAPRDFIPIFIRGGIVIPTQHVGNTTVFSRKLGMGLLVSLGENDTAVGKAYLDV
jgi:alpha-glucosidase (family GH31 glycosyl hydrolase)